MGPLAWIGLAAAGTYVYKKKPQWIPAALRPKSAQKNVALGRVTETTKSTPHPSAGMDPDMTSGQVAAANGMLTTGTDPAPLYQMASDYSALGFIKTSEALIAKADALAEARKHGAEDDELVAQMNAAVTASQAGGSIEAPSYGAPGGGGAGLGAQMGQRLK